MSGTTDIEWIQTPGEGLPRVDTTWGRRQDPNTIIYYDDISNPAGKRECLGSIIATTIDTVSREAHSCKLSTENMNLTRTKATN